MHKKIAIIFSIVFSFSFVNAQNNTPKTSTNQIVRVSGKVIDKETGLGLEYATVSFFDIEKNKIIDGTITDAKGKFSIDILAGTYTIKLEYISYRTIELSNKYIESNLDLGEVLLEIDLEALDAVEIISEKTTVEIGLDKKIYNIGKDLTISGNTATDVLDNVPSVSVDPEGSILLRGNDNVQILINGKPSGLVSTDPSELLNQLPADSIEKIEVITSPSARYDAEGAAGIINIVLRKSKIQGFNGSLTTNLGYPYAAGLSTNLNYRTKTINIFNNTSYNYRERIGHWYNDVNFYDPDTLDLNEKRRWTDIRNGIVSNTGVEWNITDKTSITNSFLYHDNTTNTESVNTIEKSHEPTNTKETIIRASPRVNQHKAFQYAFNYINNFNDKGHKFSVDFQYGKSSQNKETFVSIDNSETEKAFREVDRTDILVQSDYVLPIGENSQFEAGYRGTFNSSVNDFNVFFFDSNSTSYYLEEKFSGNFDFQQDINALYTQFGSKVKSFSYLLGLRYEGTKTIIKDPKNGEYDNELLPGFFPTVNLNYEINEKQSLSLGYNRRIRRPRSYMLNRFPSRSSSTDVFQGDPGINPTFTGSFELSYLYNFDKITLNTALYYSNSKDVITYASLKTNDFINVNTGQIIEEGDTSTPDEDKAVVVERSPVNIDKEDRYGFEFNLNYTPFKNWRINTNFNMFRFERFGGYQGNDLSADDITWTARFSNNLTLPYKINWQTNLNYRGPKQDAQNLRKGRLRINIAFSKDLFKDKASITFNISDVFSSSYQSLINTESFTAYREIQFRGGRIYNLSFTYRFNQKKKGGRDGNHGDSDVEM